MSLPRQIVTALIASFFASLAGLLVSIVGMFVVITRKGEGDPRLIAGGISGEIISALVGWLPLALFGLAFWRILTFMSQKVIGNSRTLLRQLILGVGVFVLILVFVELISLVQYQEHQFFGQTSVGGLFFILSSGLAWGVVFWVALRSKPSQQSVTND